MVDAVIAGAGIAGIATAWRLAERLGRTSAVIVDPRPALTLTSNRPEANYRDWWPQPAMGELADLSLRLVEAVRGEGAAIPMDRRGYLYVTRNPVRAASLGAEVDKRVRALHAGEGAEALDAAQLRTAYPYLSPSVLGGIRVRRAGGLDTVALGRALLERALVRGVTLVTGTVVEVDVRGGSVAGAIIDTGDGRRRLDTERFVNAAGPLGLDLMQLVGANLDVETVLRQKVVVLDRAGVIPRSAPFTITLDRQSVPWTEEERRALDGAEAVRLLGELPGGIHVKPDDTAGPTALKLGWAWDQRPSIAVPSPPCPPEFPRMVLRAASVWIPGLPASVGQEGTVVHEGGFYARVPDGQPIIGPLGPAGSYVVGAMAGFGAMMACGSGELAARWVLADEPTSLMRAFEPARFDDPTVRDAITRGRLGTGEL